MHVDLLAIVSNVWRDFRDRYVSCAALGDDIRAYLAGKAVVARQRNIIERVEAWVGAHKVHVAVGASMALLLAAGIVGARWQAAQEVQARGAALIEQAQTSYDDLDTTQSAQAQLTYLDGTNNVLQQAFALIPDNDQLAQLQQQVSQHQGAFGA